MALHVHHFDSVYLEYTGERPAAVLELTEEGDEVFVAQPQDVICVNAETAHRLLEKGNWIPSNVIQIMIGKLAAASEAMAANVNEALGVAQTALANFTLEIRGGRLTRRRMQNASDRMVLEMSRASTMLGSANAEMERTVEEINAWSPGTGGKGD